MSDASAAAEAYGDAITAPFWAGARQHKLLIQRCTACGAHQFYPRPLCLACSSLAVEWVPASGRGVVYSATVVRVPVTPELPPPYTVALVELEEGPRLLTNLVGEVPIGARVAVQWRERPPLPPLPVFAAAAGAR